MRVYRRIDIQLISHLGNFFTYIVEFNRINRGREGDGGGTTLRSRPPRAACRALRQRAKGRSADVAAGIHGEAARSRHGLPRGKNEVCITASSSPTGLSRNTWTRQFGRDFGLGEPDARSACPGVARRYRVGPSVKSEPCAARRYGGNEGGSARAEGGTGRERVPRQSVLGPPSEKPKGDSIDLARGTVSPSAGTVFSPAAAVRARSITRPAHTSGVFAAANPARANAPVWNRRAVKCFRIVRARLPLRVIVCPR